LALLIRFAIAVKDDVTLALDRLSLAFLAIAVKVIPKGRSFALTDVFYLRRFRPHRGMMISDLPDAVFFHHDEAKASGNNNRVAVRRVEWWTALSVSNSVRTIT
jgi:hypothetical protein